MRNQADPDPQPWYIFKFNIINRLQLHCPRAQEFCARSYSVWWRLWTSLVHRQKVITILLLKCCGNAEGWVQCCGSKYIEFGS